MDTVSHTSSSYGKFIKPYIVVIALAMISSAACSFIMFRMESNIALSCLVLLIICFLTDHFLLRPFSCLVLTLLLWCKR